MMRLAVVPLTLLLAACAAEKAPSPAPTPTATVAAPRTLVAADFDPAMLGASVDGMAVTDVAIGGGAAPLARLTAYVACARGATVCDPESQLDRAVYTYVLAITPAAMAEPAPTGSATADTLAPAEVPAELLRMTRPAPGFNGAVGFSRAEAAAALGADDALTVTLDQNRLIWRVTGGSGWQVGKPITLWWQSTHAPGKPSAAYRFEYGGRRVEVTAPFPAADKPVERDAAR